MNEPTTSITIATGSVALTGAVLGLQYDALLLGLLGGLVALQHLGPMSRTAMAASLAAAAVFAAAMSPVAVGAAAEYAPWTAKLKPDVARIALAFGLGLASQTIVPAALAALRALLGRFGGGQGGGQGGAK